ncbi:kinase-like protein, partial [Nadsonia fulvescens var. elongata DSM 6958]
NHGAFTEYAKYVNLDTGTLNFDGQATINAYGIEFSSGMAFRISMADLERLEPIGRGNYGTVIRVRHKPTKIIMAMKEIRLELDKAKLQQIIMELDTLNRCAKSEYIVEFYGAFFEEGTVYVCMEYMDGGSLDKIYGSPGEGVDEPYLAIIANSVVMALKELKENHNVIHRDVKPTNILASTNGKIKLCDFGVSGNLVASVAKTNIGCQSYMAPERIRFANSNQNINNHNNNSITYSSQSDIWSLGVTILEIAGGKYPYAEMFDNIFSQLNAIIEGITPSLPAEKFSPEAIDFVKRCLNKNPALRPNYSQLLNHPWLRNRNLENVDMAAFIQQRIAQR